MPLLRFSVDVQFIKRGNYYLCTHARTQAQVIITARLKEMIESQPLAQRSLEDQEEIRSLRELGFLIEADL